MSDEKPAKPYTIVFDEYPKYLYALVHSDSYGYEVLAGFLREIASECRKRDYDRVLVEENISATTSEEDVFRIASELPELGYAGLRLGYIDRFKEQSDLNEYGEGIARQTGIDVRIFADLGEADKWMSAD